MPKLIGAPKNLGLELFPDPLGQFGAPGDPFEFAGVPKVSKCPWRHYVGIKGGFAKPSSKSKVPDPLPEGSLTNQKPMKKDLKYIQTNKHTCLALNKN